MIDQIAAKVEQGGRVSADEALALYRGALTPEGVEALQAAQAEGLRSTGAIAAEYGGSDTVRAARAAVYLRDNVRYGLGADEGAGLQLFLDYAAEMGLAPQRRALEFF